MREVMRGLILSDFNISNLSGYLQNNPDLPQVTAELGPFGQVKSVIADQAHECWQPPPNYVVVWTKPETSIGGFAARLQFRQVSDENVLAEVDEYASMLALLGERVPVVLACTWTMGQAQRGLGMLDLRPGVGLAHTLMRMNLRLADRLTQASNVYLLDSQRWMLAAGPRAWSAKGWYLAKIPFDNAVFKAAVQDIKAALRGARGTPRKLVIVDADETLWGGVVGEVGWESLRVGGHDAVGEAFAEFQRRLSALTNRGVLLGIVSKNDESVVLEALERHPEMVLRARDFSGWRINWSDKAHNIAELAAELNLGLESVVFLDDHPVERARVRETLPDVLVPELPNDTLLFPDLLSALDCFDTPALTTEDVSRHVSYTTERERQAIRATIGSVEDWVRTLEMKVSIEELTDANLDRTAQLLNKTNQMNLSTRRLSAGELRQWVRSGDRRLWTLRVSDRFGDYGLVGILSLEVRDVVGHIVDFVLSCRVMGRQVEQVMLQMAERYASTRGLDFVEARLLLTPRNMPCLRFWQASGWQDQGDQRFVWTAGDRPATPQGIDISTVSAMETMP